MRTSGLTILAAALTIFTAQAHAGWVYFASGNAVTAYFDPMAITNSGPSTVMLWSLSDMTKPQQSEFDDRHYLSTATQAEFNCVTDQARLLAYRWYADNMGRGEVVHSDSDPTGWEPVEPQTLFEALRGIACGK